jgi:hypothetical protein
MGPSNEDTATGPLRCPGGRGHDRPMQTFLQLRSGRADEVKAEVVREESPGGAVVAES